MEPHPEPCSGGAELPVVLVVFALLSAVPHVVSALVYRDAKQRGSHRALA